VQRSAAQCSAEWCSAKWCSASSPGGLLTAGLGTILGLGAKKDKINTIANVVNSKVGILHCTALHCTALQVGLLGLKTNIIRAGIEGAGLVNTREPSLVFMKSFHDA
jgi:hypothetical protein